MDPDQTPTADQQLPSRAELVELATQLDRLPRHQRGTRSVVVATDGSYVVRRGRQAGAWAYTLPGPDGPQVHSGLAEPGEELSSARMELRAVLMALRATRELDDVELLVDSATTVAVLDDLAAYCRDQLRSRTGGFLCHRDLLVQIASELVATGHRCVRLRWVKAHAGNPLNTLADKAASSLARRRILVRPRHRRGAATAVPVGA